MNLCKILFITLIFTELFAYEVIDYSFITQKEYGQMLYNNPRGIGCNKCHGNKAQGMTIAKYKNLKKQEAIKAPKIVNIGLDSFKKTLNDKTDSSTVMPTYFLTNEEIESIHYYIANLIKKQSLKKN